MPRHSLELNPNFRILQRKGVGPEYDERLLKGSTIRCCLTTGDCKIHQLRNQSRGSTVESKSRWILVTIIPPYVYSKDQDQERVYMDALA